MLAQITCKEPLKHQLARNLKEGVVASQDPNFSNMSEEMRKELVEILIKDNLDIGCKRIQAEIQREAFEGIIKEETIVDAIRKREDAKQGGSEFKDYSNMNNFNKLPDILKPDQNGVSPIEYQVYRDFDTIPDKHIESQMQMEADRILEEDDEMEEDMKQEEFKEVTSNLDNQSKHLLERFMKL